MALEESKRRIRCDEEDSHWPSAEVKINWRSSWTITGFNSSKARPEIIPPNPIWLLSNRSRARVSAEICSHPMTWLSIFNTFVFVSLESAGTINREYNCSKVFERLRTTLAVAEGVWNDASIRSINSEMIRSEEVETAERMALKSFESISLRRKDLMIE